MKRLAAALALLLVGLAVMSLWVTPWPSVLAIRALFDAGAEKAANALAAKVPATVTTTANLSYDDSDPDARFDIHRGPRARTEGPVIIWFHGGGFVSGRRADLTNYLKILAGQGFTVVNVDYTIAPDATYPTPIRQAHTALAHLAANAGQLGLNPAKFVLAGDSAGAQIAAQTAAMISNPAYARLIGIAPGLQPNQLAGALLFCGVYDITQLGEDGGVLGAFIGAATWAYSGKRGGDGKALLASMSVIPHLTPGFPPSFISAGNADPLSPQSVALAQALAARGAKVTTLFFPASHQPPLAHEYQFDLAASDGQIALQAATSWLGKL